MCKVRYKSIDQSHIPHPQHLVVRVMFVCSNNLKNTPVFKILSLWFQLTVDLIKSAIPVCFFPTNSRMTSRNCSTATKPTCFFSTGKNVILLLLFQHSYKKYKKIQDCKTITIVQRWKLLQIKAGKWKIFPWFCGPVSWKQRKSDHSDVNKASVFVDVVTLNCLKSPGDTDMASPTGAVFQTPLFLILRKVSLCKLTKKTDRQWARWMGRWLEFNTALLTYKAK